MQATLTPEPGRVRDFIRLQTRREQRLAIVREVAARHDLGSHLLLGPSRKAEVCRARFEAFAVMADRLGDKPSQIGRFFVRDHTTVLHGLRRHAELQEAR